MKVMFVAAHLEYGGAERVISEVSLRLPEDIQQVLVLFRNSVTYPHRARLISLESKDVSLAFHRRAFRLLQRGYRLRRVIEAERPDCVVGFLEEANVLSAVLARRAILTVHAGLFLKTPSLARRLLQSVVGVVYSRGWVVTVSEGCRRELIERCGLPPERVVAINNPIDVEKIGHAIAEAVGASEVAGRVPRIVCAGRLSPEKGQVHLIRAFAALRARVRCQLILLGVGEMETELRRLAASLGIGNDVVFMGWLANPFPYIACGDVFALPSHWEGFGNVLLEAMACRVPVVAADCPYGPREILAPGTGRRWDDTTGGVEFAAFGVLVTPCDERKRCWQGEALTTNERALVTAIETLLRDRALRAEYVRRGMRRAEDFGPGKVVDQYVQLMRQVVSWDGAWAAR